MLLGTVMFNLKLCFTSGFLKHLQRGFYDTNDREEQSQNNNKKSKIKHVSITS
jgi:hypothetical protein